MTSFVSIIVPVFNDSEHIKKALDALVEQTYAKDSYEIIIADNGSTDDTPQVVKKYCEKYAKVVCMVVENEIQSSYAARNKGVQAARGEILAFTDSDCIPESTWIEYGVAALEEQKATCGGGRIKFFFKSDHPNCYEHFDSGRKLNQQALVTEAGFGATANFFARKEIFDRYGSFRDDLISGGDYEFGRRLKRAGVKPIFMRDALVKHPARSTLRAIMKKSLRVAKGQKQLERLGLLEHGKLSWHQLLPVKSCPVAPGWAGRISFFGKVRIILLGNTVRWVNFLSRIS